MQNNSNPESPLWTTQEVAQYLRVSPKTVFNLRPTGLPYLLLGRAVRFNSEEIKNYLTQHRRLTSHRSRQIARQGGDFYDAVPKDFI